MAFAKDLAERNLPPPDVYEVTSSAVWDEQCQVCTLRRLQLVSESSHSPKFTRSARAAPTTQGKNRICVVTILPHILDSSAKERKQQLSMLKKAAKRLKSGPFRWVWTEAGKQDDLADRLNMGGAVCVRSHGHVSWGSGVCVCSFYRLSASDEIQHMLYKQCSYPHSTCFTSNDRLTTPTAAQAMFVSPFILCAGNRVTLHSWA